MFDYSRPSNDSSKSKPLPRWSEFKSRTIWDSVVVVLFTLTDRASTTHSNIRRCQYRTWSKRGTNVNGSHHGDNPLLRPTGIQITTKSYATLQAMAPTKWQNDLSNLLYSISRAASIDYDSCRLPTTSVLTNKSDQYVPTVLINNSKLLKATEK